MTTDFRYLVKDHGRGENHQRKQKYSVMGKQMGNLNRKVKYEGERKAG